MVQEHSRGFPLYNIGINGLETFALLFVKYWLQSVHKIKNSDDNQIKLISTKTKSGSGMKKIQLRDLKNILKFIM